MAATQASEATRVGLIPNCKLVCQGAEGRVFETMYWKKTAIVKQRFDKMYRHPILNKKLTRQRLGMVRESSSLISRARACLAWRQDRSDPLLLPLARLLSVDFRRR